MKKHLLFKAFSILIFFLLSLNIYAIKKDYKGYNVDFQQVNNTEFTLEYSLDDYQITQSSKSGTIYSLIKFDGQVTTMKKGWAELPIISTSVQLNPVKNVDIEILSSEYVDYDLTNPLLPSRGTIYRNQDPSTIPYEIDPLSIVDDWYPSTLYKGTEPYILRDVRGMNIQVFPFIYNSAQNKLRVYTKITVRVAENNTEPVNPVLKQTGIVKEMSDLYKTLFINYTQNQNKWGNELDEYGELLVIYTSRDATAIQPWITWKKVKGFTVYEEEVATGTNVVSTVSSAFTAHPNLLYVQLVGDWADIKSDLGSSGNAPMDPMLGCVVGGDNYADLIIGRFSAEMATHVTTMGNKTISYERDPEIGGTWYSKGLGIASDEGAGIGDDGEIDYEHIDVIKENKLLNFTYTDIVEAYDPGATAAMVATAVNSGIGIINYCGHGDHDYFVTTSYSASDVNASTNGAKLPFVFSVACINGEFHNGSPCLAEAMLRKDGGGALATWMSTINQPWTPPQRGQDYANDILTQGYDYTANPGNGTSTTYGKTTFGAIAFNAAVLMLTESSSSSDLDTYQTWTIFGDPSVQVRTEAPKAISLSNTNITPGTFTTIVTVAGSPFQNAIVSLYKVGDPQPYAGLTDASGSVTITHPFTTGNVKLTVTGFNLATYSQDQTVAPLTLTADFSGTPLTIIQGATVDFTDLSSGPNTITSWNWSFPGSVIGSSSVQNPLLVQYDVAGTYDVTLTVSDGSGSDTETKFDYITVVDPSFCEVAFASNFSTIMVGSSVDFTDISPGSPLTWEWTFPGGTPASSTDQNPTGIVYNTVGVYPVTLAITNDFGGCSYTDTAFIEVIDNSFLDTLYADFRATTARLVAEGQTVSYEDLTIGYPTNWDWYFEGGTPLNSTDQHPLNILYSTAGSYDVRLIVTNGLYTDTITKPNYVIVTNGVWQDPNGYCDTLNNLISSDIPLTFRHLSDKWGYFPGHNGHTVKAYAEKFTNYTFSNIYGIIVPVIKAYAASSNPKVRFTVWDVDPVTGDPGTELDYKDVPIGNFTPYLYHSVIFDNNPEVDGTFYVGFQLYYNTPRDTFAVYMAPNRGNNGLNTVICKKGNLWMTPTELLGDTLNTSLGFDLIGCLVEVDEIDIESEISIYPNPSNNIVNIEMPENIITYIEINIYDIFGRQINIEKQELDFSKYSLDFSDFESGVYLIYIKVDDKLITKKVTIIK